LLVAVNLENYNKVPVIGKVLEKRFGNADFWEKSRIYMKYLTDCGHDRAHVNGAFEVVGAMSREKARTSRCIKFVVVPVFLLPNLILVLLIFETFFVNIALF
jgi:hypothetical protein